MEVETLLDILIVAGMSDRSEISSVTKKQFESLTDEQWQKILYYSDIHQIWSIVWSGIEKYSLGNLPHSVSNRLIKAKHSISYQYYSMLSFTTYILEMFRNAGIHCYLLKGIGLSSLYPREDIRKLADADVYIPDRSEFAKAEKLLVEKGFHQKKGNENFHFGYTKEFWGKIRLLEIHWRPCDIISNTGADRVVSEIFGTLDYTPDYVSVAGFDVPVLPPVENALQLLLHMFQHFVREGFGLRLLCDWCVFWQKMDTKFDEKKFIEYLEHTGLSGFAWTVTKICIIHFDLDMDNVRWMRGMDVQQLGDSVEKLYTDILTGGDFGKEDKERVVVLDSAERPIISYISVVHRMMGVRFPKMRRIPFLWPVLWGMTIIIFLRNNRKLNRGKTMDVLASSRKRSRLLKQMKVFEKKGR